MKPLSGRDPRSGRPWAGQCAAWPARIMTSAKSAPSEDIVQSATRRPKRSVSTTVQTTCSPRIASAAISFAAAPPGSSTSGACRARMRTRSRATPERRRGQCRHVYAVLLSTKTSRTLHSRHWDREIGTGGRAPSAFSAGRSWLHADCCTQQVALPPYLYAGSLCSFV